MQKLEYIFRINESEKIVFIVQETDIQYVSYDSWVMIFLITPDIKIILGYDTLHDKSQLLSLFLKKTLNNKLFLDQSKIPDIGFKYNEINYKRSTSDEKIADEKINNYGLWSPVFTKGNIQTWIYNNAQGKIELFMTPLYPFFYCRRPKKHPSYEEWIKTYQPLARYVISKKVAKQWLKQANDIMTLIATNNKRISHGGFRSPKNGQKALDNSIAYKESSSARVSVSDGEFVILIKAKGDVSHGHVAAWNELELAMQDALKETGLVNSYGKIICKP